MDGADDDTIARFALAMGQVQGALMREDVRKWLYDRDMTLWDVESARAGLNKIVEAFYHRQGTR